EGHVAEEVTVLAERLTDGFHHEGRVGEEVSAHGLALVRAERAEGQAVRAAKKPAGEGNDGLRFAGKEFDPDRHADNIGRALQIPEGPLFKSLTFIARPGPRAEAHRIAARELAITPLAR